MPEQFSLASPATSHPTGSSAPRRAATKSAQGLNPQIRALLVRAVEQRVVPALINAVWRPRATETAGARACRLITPEDAGQAVLHAMDDDPATLDKQIAKLRERGVSLDSIYTDLLTPAARRLGELWETDGRNFAEVTIGLIRLQNVQRALSPAFRQPPKSDPLAPDAPPRTNPAPSILLMPAPGSQHVFGLSMVADHFAREGWNADVRMPATAREAVRLVRATRPKVVGLSLAFQQQVDAAPALVRSLRRAAPGLLVVAGGPSVIADPELPARIGADAGAADGEQAVILTRALLYAAPNAAPHG